MRFSDYHSQLGFILESKLKFLNYHSQKLSFLKGFNHEHLLNLLLYENGHNLTLFDKDKIVYGLK